MTDRENGFYWVHVTGCDSPTIAEFCDGFWFFTDMEEGVTAPDLAVVSPRLEAPAS